MTATCDGGLVLSEIGRKFLRLHLIPELGPRRLRKLLDFFGSVDAILGASGAQLAGVDRFPNKVARAIAGAQNDDAIDKEIEAAAAHGARIISMQDEDYPEPLRQMADPPICLYLRGSLRPTDAVAISIVGTRRCSHYGAEQAVRFGELLGQAGFTVVSGLARGVDGHAHRGALRAGGRTIAVLGNGLASVYPPEHESLAEEIVNNGALMSEFHMTISPTPENFPRRNRIITGLSLGVVVVEAGKRSGALITARLAHDLNREVFAVPGRVDHPETSAGTNGLIRDGQAKLITCLEDILDELEGVGRVMGRDLAEPAKGASSTAANDSPPLSAHERTVLQTIRDGAEDADDICARVGLESGTVTTALTSLQLKGLVTRLPGNRFALRRSG